MGNLQEYYKAIDELVPGTHSVGMQEQLNAINSAIEIHSKVKPRKIVEDIAGNGAFDYPLSNFACWSEEFSRVVQVEYPVDDTSREPSILAADDWTIYAKPNGENLRFLNAKPTVLETIRVTYTARHIFDADDVCTVAPADDRAVQKLAASLYCRILAAAYAQTQDSTIPADSVDHTSMRREYEAQASKYRSEYDEHMGLGKSAASTLKPACSTQDWDSTYPMGWDRLTHSKRWR